MKKLVKFFFLLCFVPTTWGMFKRAAKKPSVTAPLEVVAERPISIGLIGLPRHWNVVFAKDGIVMPSALREVQFFPEYDGIAMLKIEGGEVKNKSGRTVANASLAIGDASGMNTVRHGSMRVRFLRNKVAVALFVVFKEDGSLFRGGEELPEEWVMGEDSGDLTCMMTVTFSANR